MRILCFQWLFVLELLSHKKKTKHFGFPCCFWSELFTSDTCTVANWLVSQKKKKKKIKQCSCKWDGLLRTVSSGSTLFAKISVFVCIPERFNVAGGTSKASFSRILDITFDYLKFLFLFADLPIRPNYGHDELMVIVFLNSSTAFQCYYVI